jgi:hypothetical protein
MFEFHSNSLYYKEKIVLTISDYYNGIEYIIDTSWLFTIEKYKYLLSFNDLIVNGLNTRYRFKYTCKIFVSGLLT